MIDNDFIWQEGKYIDFWSTTHLFIGFILAWIFLFFGINVYISFFITFAVVLGWEFFELYCLNVHEYFGNKVWDVLLGVIGFMVMYLLILRNGLMNLLSLEIWLSVIYAVLCLWGFWHHYTRKEKNVVS